MKKYLLFALIIMTFGLMSCSENYSNGERIGLVTKFSKKGLIFKSWESEINLTQTGMNTSSLFECSIDNDRPDATLIATMDSAAVHGWKVKIQYHQVFGWNWFSNRGETDFFVTGIQVLDRNMTNNARELTNPGFNTSNRQGKVQDTIYVIIIDPKDVAKYLKK